MIIYFLPAIIALGLITSYQDIKYGKIRNKWVVLGISYALAANFFLIMHAYFSPTFGIKSHYLIELTTNFLFSIIVGFGLWRLGTWTAGDGKLFIAFTALIPLTTYSIGYEEWIPSIVLLLNIFIPALVILILWMTFKMRTGKMMPEKTKSGNIREVLNSSFKEFLKPKQLANIIISLFALSWLVPLFLSFIGLKRNFFLGIIVMIAILFVIQKKFGAKAFYLMLPISIARLMIDKSVYSLSALTHFILLILAWMFVVIVLGGSVSKLARDIFSKEVKVSNLVPGMIPAGIIIKKDKSIEEHLHKIQKNPEIEIMKYNDNYYINGPESLLHTKQAEIKADDGLTISQINHIKDIGFQKIKISQTIPFAPFIFLGVIITLLLKGNLLIWIKNLILQVI
ncbi:MAG: hypothetical protein KAS15_01560 [Nanoarchaeota archaeon]|nr:hypothetical protein [Nanoarchaeota archaeon]